MDVIRTSRHHPTIVHMGKDALVCRMKQVENAVTHVEKKIPEKKEKASKKE